MEQSTQDNAERGGEIIINSGDRLTIETNGEFAQRIMQGLAEAGTVIIEFEPDVELDITALQVFCSACTKATAEGKRFIHRGPVPRALLDLVESAGSERHEHCVNNNILCFRQFGGSGKWES
jgi:hypothetical protein